MEGLRGRIVCGLYTSLILVLTTKGKLQLDFGGGGCGGGGFGGGKGGKGGGSGDYSPHETTQHSGVGFPRKN